MISPTVLLFFNYIWIGLMTATLSIVPRMWRPEVPFGVSVPFEGSAEVRRWALRFWSWCVGLLALAAVAATFLAAKHKPAMLEFVSLDILYFIGAVLIYARIRRMLLPLAMPSQKVGAGLHRRRYRDYMNPWWEVIPVALVVGSIVLFLIIFLAQSKVPRVHDAWYGSAGFLNMMGASVLVALIIIPVVVYVLLLLLSIWAVYSKHSISVGNPEVTLAANNAFRRAWIRYYYALRVVFGVLAGAVTAFMFVVTHGMIALAPARMVIVALPVVVAACVVLIVVVEFAVGFYYGQGGWRWAVRRGLVGKSQVAATFDGDGIPDRHWKLGMFYFNPSDPSIMVEDRFGMGLTLNLGSMWGIAFLISGVALWLFAGFLHIVTRH